ncbi:MAG: hypothetical protein Q7S16_00605 [bacterium]|nr:hypothetical protein [bacterium]
MTHKKKILFVIIGLIALGLVAYVLWIPLRKVNETGAIERVRALTDVQSFTETLRVAGKEPQFIAQDEDDHWLVQVFEAVGDGESEGHTATFGWYRVEKKGGGVTNEL